MTTTTTTIDTIPAQAKDTFRRRWDGLQSRGNLLDHDRAKLLHGVWLRLNKDEGVLTHFLVTVLGEYPGKRCSHFIRLVTAYEANKDQTTWAQIGGLSMVILTRLPRSAQRRILTRVRETLHSTHRGSIHSGTFRAIVQESVGEKEYRRVLTERRGQSRVRQELATLKRFLLTLLERHPEFRSEAPRAVVKSLGLDLVA